MPAIVLPALRVEFRGREAEDHRISLREVAASLTGLGRVLHAASFTVREGTPPPRRYIPTIQYYAKPPEIGCWPIELIGEIDGDLFQASSEFFVAVGHEAVQRIISAAFLLAGGRKSEMDAHIAKILELQKQVEADRHEEMMALLGKWADSEEHVKEVLEMFTEQQHNNLKAAAEPVGRSSNEARIGNVPDGGVVVDLPTAQVIRSRGRLKAGEMQVFRVLVDSITAHNRTIGVYLDGNPDRRVRGDLVDPAAEVWPNIYQDNVMRFIEVTAKPLIDNDDEIHALSVMDAREITEEEVSEALRKVAREISDSRKGSQTGEI